MDVMITYQRRTGGKDMLTELELIYVKAARDLIAPKDQWCQLEFGMFDRTELDGHVMKNVPTDALDRRTTRVCALGALRVVLDDNEGMAVMGESFGTEIWTRLTNVLGDKAIEMYPEMLGDEGPNKAMPLPWVNDNKGHAAILQVFDKVLADNGAL